MANKKKKMINLRFRAINRDIFDAIKSGKKKVETRAATERYRNIKIGDTVKLICGKNSFEMKVKKVKIFKTIIAILRDYKIKQINPNVESEKELRKMYYSFTGYRDKIRKYGLIAIELK